jgi:hypothetical protein
MENTEPVPGESEKIQDAKKHVIQMSSFIKFRFLVSKIEAAG